MDDNHKNTEEDVKCWSFFLNPIHYFIMKILNKQELQQIAFNYSADIYFKDFTNLYEKMYYRTIFFFSYWCYSCVR